MTQAPKVWILDTNAFDYTPAEAYGELVTLRGQNFAAGIDDDDSWNADIIHGFRKQLKDYVPVVDSLIPTGKPLRMCLISQILSQDHGPRHRWLAWDQSAYRYIPYVVNTAAGKN